MFSKHARVGGKRQNDRSSDAWQGFFPGRQFCWRGAGWTLLEIIISMGIVGVFFWHYMALSFQSAVPAG